MNNYTLIFVSLFAMMGIITGVVLYYLNIGLNLAEQTYNEQQSFINRWDKRIEVSNKFNNQSNQDRDKILQLQLDNERNIIGNVTTGFQDLHQHRIIANQTRDAQFALINKTNDILNKTGLLTSEEYAKLADERVNSIIGNLTEDHKIIMRALNISSTDQTSDAANKSQITIDLLQKLLNQTR